MSPSLRPVQRVLAGVSTIVVSSSLLVVMAGSAHAQPAEPEWAGIVQGQVPGARQNTTYKSMYAATRVRTSSGKSLRFAVTGSSSAMDGSRAYLSLARGTTEWHAWSFKLPASAFKMNNKGAGSFVVTPRQSAGIAKLKLTFTPKGAFKTTRCGGKVSSRSRNVVVKGVAWLNSGTKQWGKAGHKSRPITFTSEHEIAMGYGIDCPMPPVAKPPCQTSLIWSAYDEKINLSGAKVGKAYLTTAYRSVPVKGLREGYRFDILTRKTKAPVLRAAADSTSLRVFGQRGAATLTTSDAGYTDVQECRRGTQRVTNWWTPTFTNSAARLSLRGEAFGAISLPNGSTGTFTRIVAQ